MPPKERIALIRAQVEQELAKRKERDQSWDNVIDVRMLSWILFTRLADLFRRIRTKLPQSRILHVSSSSSQRHALRQSRLLQRQTIPRRLVSLELTVCVLVVAVACWWIGVFRDHQSAGGIQMATMRKVRRLESGIVMSRSSGDSMPTTNPRWDRKGRKSTVGS